MINSRDNTSTKSGLLARRSLTLLAVLVAGLGVGAASAQNTEAQPATVAPAHVAPHRSASQPAIKSVIKPGDRTCLQRTGRLIPPKTGDCLPLPGRSYSGEELRNTGAIDNAHSLQMLDPGITRGH